MPDDGMRWEIGSRKFHPNYTALKFMLHFVMHYCVKRKKKVIAIKKEKQQKFQQQKIKYFSFRLFDVSKSYRFNRQARAERLRRGVTLFLCTMDVWYSYGIRLFKTLLLVVIEYRNSFEWCIESDLFIVKLLSYARVRWIWKCLWYENCLEFFFQFDFMSFFLLKLKGKKCRSAYSLWLKV